MRSRETWTWVWTDRGLEGLAEVRTFWLQVKPPAGLGVWARAEVGGATSQAVFRWWRDWWTPGVTWINSAYLETRGWCPQSCLLFSITWRTLKTTCAQATAKQLNPLPRLPCGQWKVSKANWFGSKDVAQMVKNLPAMQDMCVLFLGQEGPWRKK